MIIMSFWFLIAQYIDENVEYKTLSTEKYELVLVDNEPTTKAYFSTGRGSSLLKCFIIKNNDGEKEYIVVDGNVKIKKDNKNFVEKITKEKFFLFGKEIFWVVHYNENIE